MAVWMPVTVVPRSAATVAMDTFITALSRIMMNWAAQSTISTNPAPLAAASLVAAFMWRSPEFVFLDRNRSDLMNGIQ
jgi:hypothetical protein